VDEQLSDVWIYDFATKIEKQITQSHNAHCGKWLNKNEVVVVSDNNIWKIDLRDQTKKLLQSGNDIINLEIDPTSHYIIYQRIGENVGQYVYFDLLALDINCETGAEVMIYQNIGPMVFCCFEEKIYYYQHSQELIDENPYNKIFIKRFEIKTGKKETIHNFFWSKMLNLNEKVLQISYNPINNSLEYLVNFFELSADGLQKDSQYFLYEKNLEDETTTNRGLYFYTNEEDTTFVSSFCKGIMPNHWFISLVKAGQEGRTWIYNYDEKTKKLELLLKNADNPALEPNY
ncbi:MAG: hypothetical protein PHW50_02415, partial [Patescibacteria group bacterium]|nr:hypothetical protein [Patescibacteria group bacterium]